MSGVFIDTNIPMYAAGASHPLQKPSQAIIMAIATGGLEAITDAEVFQEILYRYAQIGERARGFQLFDTFRRIMMGRILPIEDDDVYQARTVSEQYDGLSPRDLIHLAIMLRHGVHAIMTADTGFDSIPDIRRLDPATFEPL